MGVEREQEVEVDVKKGARQNAAEYFDRAKRAREKARAAAGFLRTLSDEGGKGTAASPKRGKDARREWFDRFRNFVSSEGNLVIAGKDAETNEAAVKKHAGKGDTIFHADPSGSPFVVIRGACGERTLSEAATFCASYSRAWQARLASVDVYHISPDQVTKRAPPGEFVPKGAFMILGRKNYFKNTILEMAVFVSPDGKVACAPPSAAPAGSIRLIPGAAERKQAIKEIKERLGFAGRDDEVDKILPPGKSQIAGVVVVAAASSSDDDNDGEGKEQ